MQLTKTQIKYLKSLAHHLSVQVTVGKEGLSEGVFKSIKESLLAHELIKVKINCEDRLFFHECAEAIASELACHLVQTLGRIAIFYLPRQENSYSSQKRSKITLPL